MRLKYQGIHLTTREWEVTELWAARFTEKEIANQLHISRHTVHAHVKHVYEKLAVHDRWTLAKVVADSGRFRASKSLRSLVPYCR
ncbi:MAG TPA: LuxR C-terminal-related transcriptional regulator [Candidatus Angelobacter sp.]|nr:LuxR C-terminal-related transcriptional regulator [Candidatus Angelobacter sp.]